MMDNLFGSKVFSVLDLKSAYFNVHIRKQDRPKTAFITKSGCCEFNYLLFGLKSAPASFMRFIHEVLYSQAPELRENTEVYLDDILIHTQDKDSHISVLEKICKCLSAFNLGINLSKCILGQSSLDYLGFKFTGKGYSATDEKVKAICDYPLQKTIRPLMRFCGMVNFYHKSILKCSSLLKPLYDTMCEYRSKPKSSVISWLAKLEKCFVSVKDALSRKTVLSYPIPNAPTFLATDASDSCIAATLYQLHPVRNERVPLAFFSRNLQKAELKYSIFDKEVL